MATSPLMDTIRLAHSFLGFLLTRSADEVAAFSQGRIELAFVPRETAADTPISAADGTQNAQFDAAPRPPRRKRPSISDTQATEIADKLRTFDTEPDGLAYLNKVATNNDNRRAVARALNIEGVGGMDKDDLITHILRHAIGARRTFAGLSKW